MNRSLLDLIREVREILRAEGIDGGGFSDFIVQRGINAGLMDIAEIYPIRDTLEFTAVEGQNEYDLSDDVLAPHGVTDIVRVIYNNKPLRGISFDDYLDIAAPTEGSVYYWMLWGKKLTLTGKVENKQIKILITRPAKALVNSNDVPEVPPIADRAIVQYAVAMCHQEARDDEAYSIAISDYYRKKHDINLHFTPRGQRDLQTKIRDTYWGPTRSRTFYRTSDTKPH